MQIYKVFLKNGAEVEIKASYFDISYDAIQTQKYFLVFCLSERSVDTMVGRFLMDEVAGFTINEIKKGE